MGWTKTSNDHWVSSEGKSWTKTSEGHWVSNEGESWTKTGNDHWESSGMFDDDDDGFLPFDDGEGDDE